MGEAKRRVNHGRPPRTDPRYWIAINGASCALSREPMRHPIITPVPEQALGFPTLEEAERAQHLCLTAPMPEVRAFFASLRPDVMTGRVWVIQPERPEPPTKGPTMWIDQVPPGAAADGAVAV